MARMAQDFSMRYTLVQGQGNFGSIDGDPPAAMRYTEARLDKIADELIADLDKDTVDFVDNFDASLKEPEVLPARIPNLLMNGSSGIAVGMATNIPPHNLGELVSALNLLIDRWDDIEEVSVEELMQHVPGPDFPPTGGVIVGTEGIRQAYSTGRGHLTMRGEAVIEEIREGRYAIVINEIPYQLNKTSLIERIAELVREGRLDAISDMRDESDRKGMRIVVELKRGTQPKKCSTNSLNTRLCKAHLPYKPWLCWMANHACSRSSARYTIIWNIARWLSPVARFMIWIKPKNARIFWTVC